MWTCITFVLQMTPSMVSTLNTPQEGFFLKIDFSIFLLELGVAGARDRSALAAVGPRQLQISDSIGKHISG